MNITIYKNTDLATISQEITRQLAAHRGEVKSFSMNNQTGSFNLELQNLPIVGSVSGSGTMRLSPGIINITLDLPWKVKIIPGAESLIENKIRNVINLL